VYWVASTKQSATSDNNVKKSIADRARKNTGKKAPVDDLSEKT
jgi:hypothetical protein